MKLLCFLFFNTFFVVFFQNKLFSQTLSVGLSENIEDSYRRQQLLGLDSSGSSYMLRPINLSDRSILSLDRKLYESAKRTVLISALPVVWQQQYNTHHPYGMNDGSMIPGKGYQTQLSAGLYAKAGPLSIQLRPEFVFAENKDYRELHEAGHADPFTAQYVKYIYNKIDLPGRFARGNYSNASWGQSNIRLTFDPISLGLSNENLWWGPGRSSSLLMSNNAAGFKHITLNTSRPVNTFIGSFEVQIIAGRLDPSGAPKINDSLFGPKSADWRYISAMALTYSPKWVPNLFLGFDRSFVGDKKNLGRRFSDYFPIFSAFQKNAFDNTGNTVDLEGGQKRDQYISAFARWLMQESKAEVYFQYGRNDHSWNLRDFIVEPEHSRAYIAGVRKLVSLKRADQFIDFGLEVIQTQGAPSTLLRVGEIWYTHYQVSGGYTNRGQILGAGIGPSNMQSFDVSWVSGLKRIGFVFDRIEHNKDLYLLTSGIPNVQPWEDLVFSGKFDWTFSNFMLNSQLTYIHSKNYQYTPEKAQNLNLKLGVLYFFK